MFTPYFRSKTTNQTRPQRPRRQLACSSKLKGSSTFTWAGHCTTWRSRSKTSPDLLRGERGNSRGFFDGFKPEDNMVILIAGEMINTMGWATQFPDKPRKRGDHDSWKPWDGVQASAELSWTSFIHGCQWYPSAILSPLSHPNPSGQKFRPRKTAASVHVYYSPSKFRDISFFDPYTPKAFHKLY